MKSIFVITMITTLIVVASMFQIWTMACEAGNLGPAVDSWVRCGSAMTGSEELLVAGTLGIGLPFLFRRIGVDPAIASGPIVTTVNDAISVSIYLGIAMSIIA